MAESEGPPPTPQSAQWHADRPVALVTGATRGLGLGVARALASTHHIVVGGRNETEVSSVVRDLPSAQAFCADLTDHASVTSLAADLSRVDVLVHCAGIVPPVGVATADAWRAVLEVNIVAVAHLTEALLPTLRRSRALVVFINSGAGLRPMGTDGYSASKFALTSYSDSLREEERGVVRVSSVHPGRIDTDMQRELQRRLGNEYRPDAFLDVATVSELVRFVVDCPSSAVVESVSIRPAG